jgi:hypothetical protein
VISAVHPVKNVSLKRDVRPALHESCLPCHYDKKQAPGVDEGALLGSGESKKPPGLTLNPCKTFLALGELLIDKLSAKYATSEVH